MFDNDGKCHWCHKPSTGMDTWGIHALCSEHAEEDMNEFARDLGIYI